MTGIPTVFISYSHKDEGWKDHFVRHLNVSVRQEGRFVEWSDEQIGAGQDWYAKITAALDAASVGVFLISVDFLGSDFILNEEMTRLIERREREGLPIVPVYLRKCDWEAVDWLSRMQIRPAGDRPVVCGQDHLIDEEFSQIAKEIRLLLKQAAPVQPTDHPARGLAKAPDLTRLPRVGEHLFGRERELALLDGVWGTSPTIAAPKRAPAAFLSYAHSDDEAHGGLITRLRERLAVAVSVAIGEKFDIFQDRDGIGWGQHWPERLDEALGQALFLIPILTPAFFKSDYCCAELQKFLELERRTGRKDLILPIYFYTARPFEQRSDPVAAILSRRQHRDWRELRHKPIDSPEVRQALEQLADEIEAAVHRPARTGEAGERAPPPEGIAEGPPVHPPAAEPPPDLELIEEERRVVRNVALRAAPSLAGTIVARLKAGTSVYVAGLAKVGGWLFVDEDGDLRGYVVEDAVEPL